MKTSSYVSALVLGLASISLVTVACGDDDTTPPVNGTSTSSSGSSGTSTSSSGSSGTSTSSSSGSSGGEVKTTALAAAICDHTAKCSPGYDAAACKATAATNTATPPAGSAKPTQAEVDACTAKYTAFTTCDGYAFFKECQFKGTGAKDAACSNAGVCAGGACTKAAATDDCGKCADATIKAKDATCAAGDTCEAGTFCADGKCTGEIAKDGDCAPTNGFLCATNTKCIGGKCVAGHPKDGDCTPAGQECAGPLVCVSGKCADRKVVALDGDCSAANQDICTGGYCDFTANKCKAGVAKDGDCMFGNECKAGLTCVAKKCTEPKAAVVCK